MEYYCNVWDKNVEVCPGIGKDGTDCQQDCWVVTNIKTKEVL